MSNKWPQKLKELRLRKSLWIWQWGGHTWPLEERLQLTTWGRVVFQEAKSKATVKKQGRDRWQCPGGSRAMSRLWAWQGKKSSGCFLMFGLPGGSAGKESACSVGDLGSIPGLGRSPGEGNGYPLPYSGLENSMDCIVHGVAKSRTRPSDFHFTSLGMFAFHVGGCWVFTFFCLFKTNISYLWIKLKDRCKSRAGSYNRWQGKRKICLWSSLSLGPLFC